MDNPHDLTPLQLDALREVANIGAGHAATALSQLTRQRIMISVPRLRMQALETLPELLGDADEMVAAVVMHMLGDLTGRMVFTISEPGARRLCDLLLGRAAGSTTYFEALEESGIKEAGNILQLTRYAYALASLSTGSNKDGVKTISPEVFHSEVYANRSVVSYVHPPLSDIIDLLLDDLSR